MAPIGNQRRLSAQYPIDGANAALLGAHIARMRMRVHASRDELAAGTRTEEWLTAVEHGAIALTKHMVEDIEHMFHANVGRTVRLEPIAIKLQTSPLGRLAHDLSVYLSMNTLGATERTAIDAADPADVKETISNRDRLLTLGPVVLLIGLTLLVGKTLHLSMEPDPASATRSGLLRALGLFDGVLAYATVLGLVFAAVTLPDFDRVLTWAARKLRSATLVEYSAKSARLLRQNGNVGDGSEFDWRVDSFSMQMVPHLRSVAANIALRAALTERLLPPLFASAMLANIVALIAATKGRWGWFDVAPMIVAWLVTHVAVRAKKTADTSAVQCYAALARALGIYDYRIPSRKDLANSGQLSLR